MTELIIWVFFALVQAEGMQIGGFKDQYECHQKLEEFRQNPDVLVMSQACISVKMVKP